MNSVIAFTLKDLGLFVLWGLLCAVLVYILLILIRAYRSVKQIMKLIDAKRIEVDKVIDELPGITANINTISGEVAHGMEAFHDTVDNIATTSENISKNVADKSDPAGRLASLMHVAAMAKELYQTYFGNKEEEEEETVMVYKEVPKSEVDEALSEEDIKAKNTKEAPETLDPNEPTPEEIAE